MGAVRPEGVSPGGPYRHGRWPSISLNRPQRVDGDVDVAGAGSRVPAKEFGQGRVFLVYKPTVSKHTGIINKETDMTLYTPAQQAHIDKLLGSVAGSPIPMAVTDDAGRVDGNGPILETDEPSRRFGVRCMDHVAIYKLKVVAKNQAALNKEK
jgi:hypothetical protein